MQTPLHLAAQMGHQDTLSILLKYDADVDIEVHTDENKQTPLHLAAERGMTNIIKLLLEHNAEINAKGLFPVQPVTSNLIVFLKTRINRLDFT